MFTRTAVSFLLLLFLLSGFSGPLMAEEEDRMNKRLERMEIAMKAEARVPAEAVKALPAPPESEAVTLAARFPGVSSSNAACSPESRATTPRRSCQLFAIRSARVH